MPPTSSFGFADVHTMGAADDVTGNDVDAVTSATSAGISAGALPRETRLTTVVIALVGGTLSSACAAWQSPGVGVALMTLSLLGTWVATARARERPSTVWKPCAWGPSPCLASCRHGGRRRGS